MHSPDLALEIITIFEFVFRYIRDAPRYLELDAPEMLALMAQIFGAEVTCGKSFKNAT